MADISSYLQKILEAVYGEEVRGSIHDALAAMNVESNNAMNFAKTAKDSATAAAETAIIKAAEALSSADEAKTSETKAKTSEGHALISETNAGNYAADAQASRTAAAASETAASNSEAVALQKATEAAASKDAAVLSEANVAAAETRVKDVKADVETLGAQATADKTAAEAAKNAAEAAKTAAQTSETNAAQSEATALASKTAAETAETNAETAQSAAESAQAAAEAAQTASETAQGKAEDSANAAASSAASAQQYSGHSPKPQGGTWWIWNAETGQYEDTSISCELVGPTGNGIAGMTHTSGDHTPGSTDVYTLTFTDGTSQTITVYNGQNGTGTGDVIGIEFDLTLPVAGWSDCELTVLDSRLIAARKYKYLVDAYDGTSKIEVVECNVKPKDVTVDGAISFTADITPINPITINILRLELGANTGAP